MNITLTDEKQTKILEYIKVLENKKKFENKRLSRIVRYV